MTDGALGATQRRAQDTGQVTGATWDSTPKCLDRALSGAAPGVGWWGTAGTGRGPQPPQAGKGQRHVLVNTCARCLGETCLVQDV